MSTHSIKLTYNTVGCSINTEQFKNVDILHVHYSLQNHFARQVLITCPLKTTAQQI